MDRSKRQELIEKATRSFKDPLLPEHARAKQGMAYELPLLTRTEMSLGNHSMMEHHL